MSIKQITFICIIINSFAHYAQNDLRFEALVKHIQRIEHPVILKQGISRVLVSSNQSQVISSSTDLKKGYCYGWLDEQAILKNKQENKRLFYGGENRFWLHPLGSKFSLYYGQNQIEPKNWKVPDLFTEELFSITSQSDTIVTFKKERATVINNIGTKFVIDIERELSIYSKKQIESSLQIKIHRNIKYVGFTSKTTITNKGKDWKKEQGLITPWTLGMFKGTATSIGIFPFTKNKAALDIRTYFFDKDNDRLKIKDSIAYFKTDGARRSKIGLPAENCKPFIGYYDYKHNRLTIIAYTLDKDAMYLSSDEEHLDDPYHGDVVNSYNNDPNKGDRTFFELETAAPAKALRHQESISHFHQTFHFEGSKEDLNHISKNILGCDLTEMNSLFE